MVKKTVEQEELSMAKDILGKINLLTDGDSGVLFRANNGVYMEISQNQLNMFIVSEYEVQEIQYNRNKKGIVTDFIKSRSFVNSKDIANSVKNTINLKNGIYYLDKTIEIFTGDGYKPSKFRYDHPKEYYSFTQLPVKYDPDATCPTIDKFIEDVFGKDRVNDVYDFIGYILMPTVKYQRSLILVGSGKNGKTTFLDMLIKFVGLDNISQTPLQDLEGKFALYNLKGKLANIVSDLPIRDLKDTGNAKRIVTDYSLSGNIKNIQGIFNFINITKMLYSVN